VRAPPALVGDSQLIVLACPSLPPFLGAITCFGQTGEVVVVVGGQVQRRYWMLDGMGTLTPLGTLGWDDDLTLKESADMRCRQIVIRLKESQPKHGKRKQNSESE
jgi:hypothetical protein